MVQKRDRAESFGTWMNSNENTVKTIGISSAMTMKQIPKEERPYEKYIAKGAESLSDAELLAAILRTGSKGESAL